MCEFCDKNSFENQVLKKSGNSYVIRPRKELNPGHVMIFPVLHREKLDDLTEEEIKDIFELVREFKRKANKAIGFNLFANEGEKAGQHIPHIHFHLIPRYKDEKESPFNIINRNKD